eukprot:4580156-Amphidinium_carterae.1
MTLDQGTIGWPLGLYIVYGLHARATVNFDIWHRVHNDWGLALKHMGLSTVKAAAQVALKMRGAPWASCHFHGLLKEYSRQHFQIHAERTALFDLLYDDLSRSFEYTGKIQAERESDVAVQACWSAMGATLEGASVGAKVKLSRWFQHEQRSRDFLKERWPLVYVLLAMGIEKKWWPCVERSPLMMSCDDASDGLEAGGENNDAADDEVLGAGGDAGSENMTSRRKRKQSDIEESKKKDASSTSILKAVTTMLCDDIAVRLWSGFCSLIVPVECWFHKGMQQARNPVSMCNWHIELVEGSLYQALLDMFSNFLSEEFARSVDFKGLVDENLSAADVIAEREILATLWELLLRCMWETGCTQLCYCMPPWSFVGLLSLNQSTVERVRSSLRKEFDMLQQMDTEIRHDLNLKEWYRHSLVPESTVCREWFVRAYELDFAQIDPEFRQALMRFASSHNTTLLIENLFNTVRKDERVASGGRLETERVWEVAVLSKEHEEFGRPHVRPAEGEALKEGHGLKGYFSGQDLGVGLTDDEVDGITQEATGWVSTNAEGYKQCHLRYQTLLACAGESARVSLAWLSTLVVPGSLLKRDDWKKVMVVVGANMHGIMLMWPSIDRGSRCITPGSFSAESFQWHCVDDVSRYKCTPIGLHAPEQRSRTSGTKDAVRTIRVTVNTGLLPLIKYGANAGFPLMNSALLKRLLKHVSIPFSGRITDRDAIQKLLVHAYGDTPVPDGVLDAAMQRRQKGKHFVQKHSHTAAVAEDETFDEELLESQSMKDDVKKLQAERKLRQREPDAHKSAASTTHPSSSSSGLVTRPVLDSSVEGATPRRTFNPLSTTGLTQEEGKQFAPPKTRLSKDATENRWKLWSPWQGGSGYVSKSYGKTSQISDNQALARVLRTAWLLETRKTGSSCPHNFDTPFWQ